MRTASEAQAYGRCGGGLTPSGRTDPNGQHRFAGSRKKHNSRRSRVRAYWVVAVNNATRVALAPSLSAMTRTDAPLATPLAGRVVVGVRA